MSVVKTILKNTQGEAAVKFAGADGNTTLDLQVDILHANQALAGGVQTVNIVGAQWVGLANSSIVVTRNGVNIITAPGDQPNMLTFEGEGYVDTVENTSDIVVTITGEAQLYLSLRKAGGYASKIETSQFSVYDNQTVVGS
jgi:hypothetical protein